MPNKKPKFTQTEASIHRQVCEYLKAQYPKVLFITDLSGIKLNIGQALATKKLRNGNGYPDLMIFKPTRLHSGLFIELKKEGTKLYLKDGRTPASPHIAEQKAVIEALLIEGYHAAFAVGFDQAKQIIDNYLNPKYHE